MQFSLHTVALRLTSFQVGEPQHRPVGIFVDPTTALTRAIRSIGVAFERREDTDAAPNGPRPIFQVTAHQNDTKGIWYFMDEHFRYLFVTTASLANIKSLKTQRRDDRYLGLCIEHHDGSIDALGQWNPADAEATETLWHLDDPDAAPLDALTFTFSRNLDTAKRFCTGVVVGCGDGIDRSTRTVTDFSLVSRLHHNPVDVSPC